MSIKRQIAVVMRARHLATIPTAISILVRQFMVVVDAKRPRRVSSPTAAPFVL
jgi:hypothetical protein